MPDPGSYHPNSSPTKQQAPGIRIGNEKRPNIGGNPVKQPPGPGNYQIKSAAFTEKPHFYIGQKLKD